MEVVRVSEPCLSWTRPARRPCCTTWLVVRTVHILGQGSGNMYGTTAFWGSGGCGSNYPGCGMVIKVDEDKKETILRDFAPAGDGAQPFAVLIRDRAGTVTAGLYFVAKLPATTMAVAGRCLT